MLDSFEADPNTGQSMLFTAEAVAKEGGFEKSQLDEVTLRRWHQYEESLADDRAFQRRYMVPITAGSRRKPEEIASDWGIRPATEEGLASLKPVQPDGVVSYGAQTHPADGAAGLIVTTPVQARSLGVNGPVARILSTGFARVDAARMPKAPVPAANNALVDAGLSWGDIDVVKTHNPFAVNDLWFARETGYDLRRDEPIWLQPDLRAPPGTHRGTRHHRADVGVVRPRRWPGNVHGLRSR